jgi:hypothetical protein
VDRITATATAIHKDSRITADGEDEEEGTVRGNSSPSPK